MKKEKIAMIDVVLNGKKVIIFPILIISFRCLTFILARLIMTTPNYH
jgi:hypothetical protein